MTATQDSYERFMAIRRSLGIADDDKRPEVDSMLIRLSPNQSIGSSHDDRENH